jgi:hypothetical protein
MMTGHTVRDLESACASGEFLRFNPQNEYVFWREIWHWKRIDGTHESAGISGFVAYSRGNRRGRKLDAGLQRPLKRSLGFVSTLILVRMLMPSILASSRWRCRSSQSWSCSSPSRSISH